MTAIPLTVGDISRELSRRYQRLMDEISPEEREQMRQRTERAWTPLPVGFSLKMPTSLEEARRHIEQGKRALCDDPVLYHLYMLR